MSYAALIISLLGNLAALLALKKSNIDARYYQTRYIMAREDFVQADIDRNVHTGTISGQRLTIKNLNKECAELTDCVSAYTRNTSIQAKKLCALARKLAQAKRALRIAKITRKVVVK
jgi:hypothetical protein